MSYNSKKEKRTKKSTGKTISLNDFKGVDGALTFPYIKQSTGSVFKTAQLLSPDETRGGMGELQLTEAGEQLF